MGMHGVFQVPIPWNRSLANLIFRLIAGERMSARQTVVTWYSDSCICLGMAEKPSWIATRL